MIPYSMNPLGIGMFYTDLDILRQIRDANPSSQLPSLWLDSEDPYTQWEGVTWSSIYPKKTLSLEIIERGITNVSNINKLKNLTNLQIHNTIGVTPNVFSELNLEGMTNLTTISAYYNDLSNIILTGCTSLTSIVIKYNRITAIPSLLSKGLISNYDFRWNNMPTSELDRLRALGFTNESNLLPQNP